MATTSGCSVWTATSLLPRRAERRRRMRRTSSSVLPPRKGVLITLTALALAGGIASGCGGGGSKSTAEPTTTTTATETAAAPAASGAQLFSDNCEPCHGPNGAGGHVGPNLQKSPVAQNLARVEKQIRNGSGAMPPFEGMLSNNQIDVIAKYVVEQIAPKG
jgi:mono/diheme cytochrome c family protein